MAYLGKGPEQVLSGVASKSTFTGDGSTTTFDISTDIPAGGENDIQVFVDNVRQEPGSSASYTVGVDGSGNLRRITFNVAPEASQAIYVINPRRLEAFGQVPDNSIATVKLQDTSVTTAKIDADAITEAKIADDAISDEHLDVTSITGHTELSEGRADGDFILIYDSSTSTLKKIQASNLGILAPSISSVSPTSVVSGDGTGNYTFTITGTNFSAGTTAKLITNSGSDVAFDTVTRNSSTQLTGVIAKSSLLNSGEPFDVSVTSNTLTATLENQINIDASPTFNTASGSLGTVLNGAVGSTTLEVVAFDPESAGNVTFEIITGSLPAGASGTTVNEDGVSKFRISGFSAVGSNTTSTFTVRAADVASNTSSRQFSITVNAPVSESFTTSGTFSVPTGLTAVDVLVVAGGGSGGCQHGGAGGAGGLIFVPGFTVTPGGTVSVTVGCGGISNSANTPRPSPSMPSYTGQDSVFGTLTAKGGGYGSKGPDQCAVAGGQGGSGGGGGYEGPAAPAGQGTQPTQPGQSGTYGFGNPGGAMSPHPTNSSGGGGGGAGAAGSSLGDENGGAGGVGKAYTISDGTTPVYYAGGGGGGGHSPLGGTGGQGGGGNGGGYVGPTAVAGNFGQPGTANRGGGGGGNGRGISQGSGPLNVVSAGGKGIVIVRY
jgi:hypothetical protein